jgi:ABC-type transport system involved in cytochrome c biogenesis ATPase subunit
LPIPIRRVRIEGFKRFDDVEFVLPGHIVVAGPNNAGKTTLLQAIAAWNLALTRWKELNDFQRHGGGYTRAPIARQAFSAVPLRSFDLLWRNRTYRGELQITIVTDEWTLPLKLEADSTEQIYVRPAPVDPQIVRRAGLTTVLVPPMTGLGIDEPVYQRPKLDQLLGQGKPGDMLRNLLVEAHQSAAWDRLQESIRRLFGYQLEPPNATGAHIVAEYRSMEDGPRFDIASAGSGFQQVLMLLAMLSTRPGAVLLLDEPDAHLHMILQDAIYGELRSNAARTGAQLVVATHSEVIIDAVDARELCILLDRPRMLADDAEREALIESLRVLSNDDIMRALQAPGVLYLEGHTDLELLRAFAKVLNHPAEALLTRDLFWKPTVGETQPGRPGIKARDHYDALRLVRDIPALELVDGDSHAGIGSTNISGAGFQRWRWRRYEIESHLVHPVALARFITATVGEAASAQYIADLRAHLTANLPPAVMERPLDNHVYLNNTKARTDILPAALSAGGLPGLPYTRYHEIAALMLPEEIHPDVREALDAIVGAFGR